MMPSTDPKAPSPSDGEATANPADALPARTTPTWEVEILLSGATVFVLFQLYGWIAETGLDLITPLSREMQALSSPLFAYLQGGVLALAIGFVVHLLLRAAWVANVGLHSVDPRGEISRNRSLGPVQRRMVDAAWAAMPQRIALLDDASTIVFAASLGFAKLMASAVLHVFMIVGASFALERLTGGRWSVVDVAQALSVSAVLPALAANAVDYWAGRRGIETPAPFAALMRLYQRIGMTADHHLGVQMLSFRANGRRGGIGGVALTIAIMVGLMVLVAAVSLWQQGLYARWLQPDEISLRFSQHGALRSVHYLDRQPEAGLRRVPAIPAPVVDGAYLELSIPYVEEWHKDGLNQCISAVGNDDWRFDLGASEAVLACMAARQAIRIDDQPMPVRWRIEDSATEGQGGFRVLIDVRNLPRGEHRLEIDEPPEAAPEGEAVERWRIPFWT